MSKAAVGRGKDKGKKQVQVRETEEERGKQTDWIAKQRGRVDICGHCSNLFLMTSMISHDAESCWQKFIRYL